MSGARCRRIKRLRIRLVAQQEGRCHFCSVTMTVPTGPELIATDATVEHLVPLGEGGADREHNCVAACFACNQRRNTERQKYFQRIAERSTDMLDAPRRSAS